MSKENTAQVLDFKPASPAPDPPLDALLARRVALGGEQRRLDAVARLRDEAQARLVECDSEQDAIDIAESVAFDDWAKNPEGDLPPALTKRRATLAQRRVLAAGDLAAAHNGAKAVASKMAEITAELGQIDREIRQIKLRSVQNEILIIATGIREGQEAATAGVTRLRGLLIALSAQKTAAENSGDASLASAFQGALSDLENLKSSPPSPTWQEVEAQAVIWREALA
jgi:hypothetical protein